MVAFPEAPIDLTRSLRDVSVTERGGFRNCRRRWYLETIENLERRGLRNWNLDFGTGIHSALEAFYKACGDLLQEDPLDAALRAFHEWYEEMDSELVRNSFLDSAGELRDELLEYKALGEGMLRNYNEYAVETDDFDVVAVEGLWTPKGAELVEGELRPPYGIDTAPILHESGRVLVPIVNPDTKEWIEGHPYLSMRLDLIIFRRTMGLRGFWVMDHKTSASTPSDRGIDFEDQITGYDYGFWRWAGVIPRGTIFDYLVKQLPKPPKIVYDGTKLSTDKAQLCLPGDYWDAMVQFGHVKNGRVTSEKHLECWQGLKAKGWKPFFQRPEVERNEHELLQFERRLFHEYQDMKMVFDNPLDKAYPNLSYMHCPGCPVNSICQAIEDGSDYEFIIEARYQQAADRKAK